MTADIATAADVTSVKEWLAIWAAFVRDGDFDNARRLFSPDVVAFGSVVTAAESLDELEESQWREVWPQLGSFEFEDDHLRIVVSSDRLLAAVAVTWTSSWVGDGSRRPRPGRASIVLNRAGVDDGWRAVHTHFSLNPG